MTKRRRKVTVPAVPPSLADQGPSTEMQSFRTVTEPVPEDKNGSKRKVRKDAIDRIAALTDQQRLAGRVILQAYEALGKGPPAIKEIQVDTSPRADAIIDALIFRQFEYVQIMQHVPNGCRSVVEHVCNHNRGIRDGYASTEFEAGEATAHLKLALDVVGQKIGLY